MRLPVRILRGTREPPLWTPGHRRPWSGLRAPRRAAREAAGQRASPPTCGDSHRWSDRRISPGRI